MGASEMGCETSRRQRGGHLLLSYYLPGSIDDYFILKPITVLATDDKDKS